MGEGGASRRATALALGFAMLFPTLTAWGYFVALSRGGQPSAAQQAGFAAGKVLQFAFPLVFLLLCERRLPRWRRPSAAGLALGLGFGAAVLAGMLALYYGGLRSSALLAQTPARVRAKLAEVGVTSPAGFLLLAAGYVVVHSFLEEYYWRWFVFGRLRTLLPLAPALALSSVAFASHHVIVLGVYLPGKVLTGVLPLALAVALGGGVWAWLYERGGSLAAPWVSHALADAGIFLIGWDLFRRGWAPQKRTPPRRPAGRGQGCLPAQSSSLRRTSAGSISPRRSRSRGFSRPAFSRSDWLMMSSSCTSSRARWSAGSSYWIVYRRLPMEISSRGCSSFSWTRTLLTLMPLVLLQSRMYQYPLRKFSSQWIPEMFGKRMGMSQDSRRPMVSDSRIRGMGSPPPTGISSPCA
jgi:uncharacterized protein